LATGERRLVRRQQFLERSSGHVVGSITSAIAWLRARVALPRRLDRATPPITNPHTTASHHLTGRLPSPQVMGVVMQASESTTVPPLQDLAN